MYNTPENWTIWKELTVIWWTFFEPMNAQAFYHYHEEMELSKIEAFNLAKK